MGLVAQRQGIVASRFLAVFIFHILCSGSCSFQSLSFTPLYLGASRHKSHMYSPCSNSSQSLHSTEIFVSSLGGFF